MKGRVERVIADVLEVFTRRGAGAYLGENVSMTEHALQAAHFAVRDGAKPALVIAALLHDVGHLIEHVPDDIAEWTVDARHEEIGSQWLAERFPADVSEPVRLHVAAKRYLCATRSNYLHQLSAASVITLELQGGVMSADEARRFEALPHHRDAVRVRQWDDHGKVAGLLTPTVADYRSMLEEVACGY